MNCENVGFRNYDQILSSRFEKTIPPALQGQERLKALGKQHLIDRVSAFVFAKIITVESTLCRLTAVIDYTFLAISNKNPQILRNAALHLLQLVVTLVALPILGFIGLILPEIASIGADFASTLLDFKLPELLSPVKENTIQKDGKFVGTYLDISSDIRSIISCGAKVLESPLATNISVKEQFDLISAIFTVRVQSLRSVLGT